MKIQALVLFMLVTLLSVTGCIRNPINAKTGANYYQWGMDAERNGDLTLARQNYSRAYANAQMGNLGPKPEAYSLYEWSRVTGYLGMYADAEKGFNDVLALIDKSEGKAENLRTPALLELARLLHDTGQHEKAIPFYQKATAEVEKGDIASVDPIGYALVLDDYAQSLQASGNAKLADEITARSASIKEANKGIKEKFIGRRYKNP
jgi:tetratricopeptide (TPR) repeat protein